MKLKSLSILFMTSALLCAQSANEQNAIEIGEKSSAALLQKLGGELKANLQKNGPAATVGFCSSQALALTHEVSKATGYPIKRITLRERNPQNGADASEKEVLESLQNSLSRGEALPPYILKETKNGYLFYKPILINNEACLKCHGTIDPGSDVAQAIKAAYPHDKATGYKMGDLRGAIAVTIGR